MVMLITSRTSLFGIADNLPGSRSKSFLDVLIAGRLGGGKVVPPRAFCTHCSGWLYSTFFPLLRRSWGTRNGRTQTFWPSGNGAQSPAPRCGWLYGREKSLLQRPLYGTGLGWSAPLGLPVCSVVWTQDSGSHRRHYPVLIGRGGHCAACCPPHALVVSLQDLDICLSGHLSFWLCYFIFPGLSENFNPISS